LVDDETVYNKDISDELIGTTTPLRFNGQLAGDQLNPDAGCGPGLDEPCFLAMTIPSAGVPGDYTAAIQALDEFQPDVIVTLTGAAFISNILDPLEAGWDVTRPARPFYLTSPYQYGLQEVHDAVVTSTQQNKQCNGSPCPTLTHRLLGINFESARDQTVVGSYRTRDHQYTPGTGLEQYDFFENIYDAAWYMFYAIAAAGDVQLTGDAISRGMGRLIKMDSGRPFAVGPSPVPDALYALGSLSSANGIELDGAMGPPDFDPASGARKTLGSAYCLTSTGTLMSDVMRYETTPAPASMTTPAPSTCVPPGF